MKNYIDLHMHSKYSDDGEYEPAALVKKCYENNIKIMAIADHNSIKAIEVAKKEAEKFDIKYINAIEIDCTYKNINLHVLGYGINNYTDDFENLEKNILEQELNNSQEKIKLTNSLGFDIDIAALKKLSHNGVYTGEMFAEVLLNDKRYLDHPLLKPYRLNGYRQDNPYVNFYWDYYAQGKPCYTKIIYPTLKDTINLIKKHGGVAILAHPGNNLKDNYKLFDEMIALGLDGVEVFSSYHDNNTSQYFYQTALKYNLLITCGSDYHGKTKPSIDIGKCNCLIDEKIIEEQLKKYNLI